MAKRKTSIKYKTLNAYYNEVFTFDYVSQVDVLLGVNKNTHIYSFAHK